MQLCVILLCDRFVYLLFTLLTFLKQIRKKNFTKNFHKTNQNTSVQSCPLHNLHRNGKLYFAGTAESFAKIYAHEISHENQKISKNSLVR